MVEPHAVPQVANVVLNLGMAVTVGLQARGVAIPGCDEGVIAVIGQLQQLGPDREFNLADDRPISECWYSGAGRACTLDRPLRRYFSAFYDAIHISNMVLSTAKSSPSSSSRNRGRWWARWGRKAGLPGKRISAGAGFCPVRLS